MKWRTRLILGAGLAAVVVLGFACPLRPRPLGPHNPTHAQSTTFNLRNAISAYQTEYLEYPLPDSANDLTIESGHALMDVLFGSDAQKAPSGRNPRGIAFYTDKAAGRMGDGRFRKGVTVDATAAGELWDPWGNHYRVRLDTNGDGKLDNPEAPGKRILESILVWSAGPDGDFETWKDNVKTW